MQRLRIYFVRLFLAGNLPRFVETLQRKGVEREIVVGVYLGPISGAGFASLSPRLVRTVPLYLSSRRLYPRTSG